MLPAGLSGDSFARHPKCAILTRMNERESLENFTVPQTLQRGLAVSASNSLSIAGVPGEVSHQKVACCFPIASHCQLGAAGSYGRQGTRPCHDMTIVNTTIRLGKLC
jgi:hypothetical protein